MNKIPASWDNTKGNKLPEIWSVSDNNSIPDRWKNNITDQFPKTWGGKTDAPDNWGRSASPTDRPKTAGSSAAVGKAKEGVSFLTDKAKSGAGIFAGAAQKLGNKVRDSVPESAPADEHDKAIDDMISAALSAGDEIQDSDIGDIDGSQPAEGTGTGSVIHKAEYDSEAQNQGSSAASRRRYSYEYTPPKYDDDDDLPEEDLTKVKIRAAANNMKDKASGLIQDVRTKRTEVIENTSSATKVIVCLIILLVAIVIIFNSIVFTTREFKSSKNKNQNVTTIETTAPDETTEAEDNTSATTDAVVTSSSDSNETSTAATTKAPVIRVDTSEAVKRAITAHFDRKYANEKENRSNVMDRNAKYALYDVDDDGADELFINYSNAMIGGSQVDIYLYSSGSYILAKEIVDGGASVSLSDHFIMTDQYGGGRYTRIFNISDGKLVQTDELFSQATVSFTRNGASISQSEYDQLIAQYESKNLKRISETSSYCSSLVDTSIYTEIKNYSIYDTSAATSDFDFYSSSKSATVNVTSGGLNLRATPEYNGEIIVMMTKDATVTDYGSNNQWAYVRYTEGSKTYFGYASKQYLDYHENVIVYSCKRFGRIKLNSGELHGFNRAYVVDSGTLVQNSISLQNGWHVKAVNYCVSKGITWYELYDADDGDYYGWIDGDFITFD